MSEIDQIQIEKKQEKNLKQKKNQGAGGAGRAGGASLMKIEEMEDDYDYYESQAAKIRQNEITSKTVWQAAVSAINDSKTR
ncbi:MAG: hypothetical protein EZS28_045172, partial [Streblomastix strix]